MSSAQKSSKNNPTALKNNQLKIDKNAAENTAYSNLQKNKSTADNVPQNKEIVQPTPPSNLTIVRQASFSSEDAKSKNNITSQQSKTKKQKQKMQKPKQQKPQIKQKQSDKKGESIVYDEYNVLKISGLLDAYEHFLKLLCKNGLPTGKVYDYAAQEILKYQKKKINKQLKMRAQLDIQKIVKKNDKASPSPQRPRASSPYYH